MAKYLTHKLIYSTIDANIWNDLHECFSKVNGTMIFHCREIYHAKQGIQSITSLFGHLKMLWDELKVVEENYLYVQIVQTLLELLHIGTRKNWLSSWLDLMRHISMFVQIF